MYDNNNITVDDVEDQKKDGLQPMRQESVCMDCVAYGWIYSAFSHWSNQSMKLRCQRRLFCGRSTQWVSSGK